MGADPDMVTAFNVEYGLSVDDFTACVVALEDLAVERRAPVVSLKAKAMRSYLLEKGIQKRGVDAWLAEFVLRPRGEWETPSEGFGWKHIAPWRFGRRLSVMARPLIAEEGGRNPTISYSVAQLEGSARNLINRIAAGHLPEGYFRSAPMKAWIGQINDRKGKEFEEKVRKSYREQGWEARSNVSMREFGADPELGDVDVLSWDIASGRLWIIECKRLRTARTIGEVGDQLRRFRGEAKDELARHLARVGWLESHRAELCRVTGMAQEQCEVTSLLVTSAVVPMQFVRDLPIPRSAIVPFLQLASRIPRVVGLNHSAPQ